MMLRALLVVVALTGCTDASLGDGPNGSTSAPDAGTTADATPAQADADIGPTDCDDPVTYYRDNDVDGYGDPNNPVDACQMPAGYVTDATDCNDGDREVNPAGIEVCGDLKDNDCSGADACLEAQVAHWSFDVDTGDSSGNGNNGIARNGATIAGGAATFDGVDDFIEVPHNALFVVPNGTLSVWFRTDAIGQVQGLWSKDSGGLDNGGHLTLTVRDTGNVRARLQSATNSYEVEAGPVSAGVSYHVVVTFGAAGLRLYLNGVAQATNGYTGGTLGNLEPMAIGSNTQSSGDLTVQPVTNPQNGAVYDARFYDRALTAGEIGELYTLTTP